jgi:hypothetical protein
MFGSRSWLFYAFCQSPIFGTFLVRFSLHCSLRVLFSLSFQSTSCLGRNHALERVYLSSHFVSASIAFLLSFSPLFISCSTDTPSLCIKIVMQYFVSLPHSTNLFIHDSGAHLLIPSFSHHLNFRSFPANKQSMARVCWVHSRVFERSRCRDSHIIYLTPEG